jgi:hypothetical protein
MIHNFIPDELEFNRVASTAGAIRDAVLIPELFESKIVIKICVSVREQRHQFRAVNIPSIICGDTSLFGEASEYTIKYQPTIVS